MIVLAFLLANSSIEFIVRLFKKQSLKHSIASLSSFILSILFFYCFAKLTDNHIGRTDNPSGFFLYFAELDNILVPSYGPIGVLLKKIIPSIKLEGEGNAYVGIVNALFFIYIIVVSIGSLFLYKARTRLSKYFADKRLNISLLAALLVLIIAMGIPFVQFPDLLDHFSVIKQFRAIGRFSWPFFFVFSAFSAFHFQNIILYQLRNNRKIIGIGLLVLILCLPFYEGIGRQKFIANNVNGNTNLFEKELINHDLQDHFKEVVLEKYQAIFSLP